VIIDFNRIKNKSYRIKKVLALAGCKSPFRGLGRQITHL